MEASIKIELPTNLSERDRDSGDIKRSYIANVLYDANWLKDKNVKSWQEGGDSNTKCAIFSGGANDKPVVINMSKDALVKKLTELGVWEVKK